MTIWSFGSKDKEQDKKKIMPTAKIIEASSETEILPEEEKKPGTGELNLLIAASVNRPATAPQKSFPRTLNPVVQPEKQEQPKINSGSANFKIQPTQKQNSLSEKVRTAPEKNLTQEFGILSIEEQKRLDEENAKPPTEKKISPKRKTLGRTNEVKVRLTDDEKKLLEGRVWASGMKQGEFVRQAILHEKIETRSVLAADARTMSELMKMGSELGKIGGLIKKTVTTNKEFAIFTPEEKSQFEKQMRDLETLRREIQKVVQDIYGNH